MDNHDSLWCSSVYLQNPLPAALLLPQLSYPPETSPSFLILKAIGNGFSSFGSPSKSQGRSWLYINLRDKLASYIYLIYLYLTCYISKVSHTLPVFLCMMILHYFLQLLDCWKKVGWKLCPRCCRLCFHDVILSKFIYTLGIFCQLPTVQLN